LFLEELGIESKPAQKRLRNQTTLSIGHYLAGQTEVLTNLGRKKFADLIATNIRHVFRIFDLTIPPAAAQRDLFTNRGGAWQLPS
jgi:hypothetical protein